MKIEVLGAGCARCQELEELVRATVQETGVSAEIEHVRDMKRIAGHGVLSTPALVIDGKVVCAGRVPKRAEVMGWVKG
jgi:small redox-active disulfide protein 2